MRSSGRSRRFAAMVALGLVVAVFAPQHAAARSHHPANVQGVQGHRGGVEVRFSLLRGFDDPATPDNLDKVGVLQVGSARARNVLVLNPGTSAGAADGGTVAADVVKRTHGRWQVWSVERREKLLEIGRASCR